MRGNGCVSTVRLFGCTLNVFTIRLTMWVFTTSKTMTPLCCKRKTGERCEVAGMVEAETPCYPAKFNRTHAS